MPECTDEMLLAFRCLQTAVKDRLANASYQIVIEGTGYRVRLVPKTPLCFSFIADSASRCKYLPPDPTAYDVSAIPNRHYSGSRCPPRGVSIIVEKTR